MELGVGDRIVLLSLLPREGDLPTIRIVHELRQTLAFTEDEHETFQIKTEGDRIAWADGADGAKEVSIGPRAHTLIAEALEGLNEEGKITEDHLSLWERFIDAKD